ncbi:MAG: extracellular solute-binding protein [Ignavibacteriales bacterium]|nr:extracellular solute-binding protein [Ignavibacteriales bacterium]
MPKIAYAAVFVSLTLTALKGVGCVGARTGDINRVVIWHQMRPDERSILQRQIKAYMALNPGVEIVELYKETEDVRNAFVTAALTRRGPDLVYGPSDAVGIYVATKTIQPLESHFPGEFFSQFDSSGILSYQGHVYQIADKIGNHLALVYNKKYVQRPPQTDVELIEVSKRIQRQYGYVGGRPKVYGLTWNYTEPFFFIPFFTGCGGWVFQEDGVTPSLDDSAMIAALKYVRSLRDEHKIVPNESDYEIADALFKDGKAAMIINGDWSWAGYKELGIDIGVTPIPKIVSTSLWPAPMTSPKGFSLNANVGPEKLPRVLSILTFLLSEENQLETTKELKTAPTLKTLYKNPAVRSNEILQNSLVQIGYGRPMPVVPEMRAVWDAMRPGYQAVMGGASTPEESAKSMQQLALRRIKEMNE